MRDMFTVTCVETNQKNLAKQYIGAVIIAMTSTIFHMSSVMIWDKHG